MKKTKRLLALFLTLCMTATMFPSMAMASISMPDEANYDVAPIADGAPEVSPATLADNAEPAIPQKDLYKSYSAKITGGAGTKEAPKVVKVSAEDLVKHKSAKVSDQQMGYWVGVTFAPPEGVEADSLKFKEGTTDAIFEGDENEGNDESLNGGKTWSYYFDADPSKGKDHFVKLVWSKADTNKVVYYKIDSSDVKTVETVIKQGDIVPAQLVDHSSDGALDKDKLVDDGGAVVSPTRNDNSLPKTFNVDITGENIKFHTGEGKKGPGYWVGFGVKAPTNAKKYRVAFNTSEFAAEPSNWENESDTLDSKINGTDDGFALYYDAASWKGKRDYVALQFTDAEGNAVTPVTYFNVNLSGVTTDTTEIESVGFTYDVDNNQLNAARAKEEGDITDCSKETMYVKLNQDVTKGKYMVVVTDPENNDDFFYYGGGDTDIQLLYWSYLNADQVAGAPGALKGPYKFQLYTYTGAKNPSGVSFKNHVPECESCTFVKLGDPVTLKILGINDMTVSAKLDSENSAETISVARVEGTTIYLKGILSSATATDGAVVTLSFESDLDNPKLKIKLKKEGDSWTATLNDSSDQDGIRLLKTEGEYTINADEVEIIPEKVEVEAGKPEASVPDNLVDKEAVAEGLKKSTTEMNNIMKDDVIQDAVKKELAVLTSDVVDEYINTAKTKNDQVDEIDVVVFLEIKATNYDGGAKKALTVNITPKMKLVAKDADGTDTVEIGGTEKEIPGSAIKESVKITIGLPANFTTSEAYIAHKGHVYTANVTGGPDAPVAEFTNPDGFSEFVITAENPSVAKIGSDFYDNLQDAVNAVEPDGEIELQKAAENANLTVIAPAKNISFTIKKASDLESLDISKDVIVSDNGYYKVSKDTGASASSVTYTVKYDAPYTPPSTPSATVNTASPVNGYFSVSNPNAKADDTVTVDTKPNDGYVVDQVTVTDKNGGVVEVKDNGDGTYSFTMPADDLLPVDVKVTFKEDAGGEVTPPTENALVFSSTSQEKTIKNRTTTDADTSLKLKAADEGVTIGSLKDWDVTSDNEAVVQVLQPSNKLRYMGVGTANITVKATGSNDKVYSIVIPINVKLGTPTFTLSHCSSKKARTFTVTTSTVRGATGFQVKYSLKKSLKSSKTKTYKCGKKLKRQTIKANKTKRTYYVRVRAYKTVDGKRTYGAWSKLTKTIKSK